MYDGGARREANQEAEQAAVVVKLFHVVREDSGIDGATPVLNISNARRRLARLNIAGVE